MEEATKDPDVERFMPEDNFLKIFYGCFQNVKWFLIPSSCICVRPPQYQHDLPHSPSPKCVLLAVKTVCTNACMFFWTSISFLFSTINKLLMGERKKNHWRSCLAVKLREWRCLAWCSLSKCAFCVATQEELCVVVSLFVVLPGSADVLFHHLGCNRSGGLRSNLLYDMMGQLSTLSADGV